MAPLTKNETPTVAPSASMTHDAASESPSLPKPVEVATPSVLSHELSTEMQQEHREQTTTEVSPSVTPLGSHTKVPSLSPKEIEEETSNGPPTRSIASDNRVSDQIPSSETHLSNKMLQVGVSSEGSTISSKERVDNFLRNLSKFLSWIYPTASWKVTYNFQEYVREIVKELEQDPSVDMENMWTVDNCKWDEFRVLMTNYCYSLLHRAVWMEDEAMVAKTLHTIDGQSSTYTMRYSPLHAAAFIGNSIIVQLLMEKRDKCKDSGFTVLQMAVLGGNGMIVIELLRAGENINAKFLHDEERAQHIVTEMGAVDLDMIKKEWRDLRWNEKHLHGQTTLHIVVKTAAVEILKIMKEWRELRWNEKNLHGETPLHIAVRRGTIDILKEMKEVKELRWNEKYPDGDTPLHYVALKGKIDILKEMKDVKELGWNEKNHRGETPLHIVVKTGAVEILKIMKEWRELRWNEKNPDGDTPLHYVARKGKIDILKEMKDVKELRWNEKNLDGNTPLHYVALKGKIDILKEMKDVKELGWNEKNHRGETPLHIVVKTGAVEILKIMKEWRELRWNEKNPDGDTPLHYVARKGKIDILKEMKDVKELRWNEKNLDGNTPLHYVALKGKIDILKEMKDVKELGWNEKNHRGETPLHYVAREGKIDILEEMKDVKELGWNEQNHRGETPLHYVARKGKIDILKEMKNIEQLDWNQENNEGHTAVEIAHNVGHRRVEIFLMEIESVNRYVDSLFKDRQVFVDAANAILVGAALIASVAFASWLQPPLGFDNTDAHVHVEHNRGLQAFWVCNAFSFYFAMATVISGARSVLPRRSLFIRVIVGRIRTNLFWTSVLLAISIMFAVITFSIAGNIVLKKLQVTMIVPSVIGGGVCLVSLIFLIKSIYEEWNNMKKDK